jgi:hypothetical protein
VTDASRPAPGRVHGVPPRRWAPPQVSALVKSLVRGARIERVIYVLESDRRHASTLAANASAILC